METHYGVWLSHEKSAFYVHPAGHWIPDSGGPWKTIREEAEAFCERRAEHVPNADCFHVLTHCPVCGAPVGDHHQDCAAEHACRVETENKIAYFTKKLGIHREAFGHADRCAGCATLIEGEEVADRMNFGFGEFGERVWQPVCFKCMASPIINPKATDEVRSRFLQVWQRRQVADEPLIIGD